MGEAKIKQMLRATGSTKLCHTNKREQLNLGVLLVRRKNSTADRRRNARVFAEFQMEDLVEQLVDLTDHQDGMPPGAVKQGDWASKEPIEIELTGDTIDHVLKVLDTEIEGPAGVILHGLEIRLKQVESDTYSPPPGLLPDAEGGGDEADSARPPGER